MWQKADIALILNEATHRNEIGFGIAGFKRRICTYLG
jgi:hypothetical protein